MKSILLHVQDDPSLDSRLECALSLARACGGHLTCLHVTPIEAYVAFDSFGGVFVMQDVLKALDDQEAALRRKVEADLSNEDVSWDYEQVTGAVANVLVSRAALSDLIVVGRDNHAQAASGTPISLLGDLLFRARSPLFIPGSKSGLFDPAAPALIAWDGSYEAANAVRASLGLLRLAPEVRVVRVEDQADEMFPSTRLLEYLSRHGISAELQVEPVGDANVVPLMLSEAERVGAAYLVIGGYSHSRVGEYIFGGVTRELLKDCPVSLVVAH